MATQPPEQPPRKGDALWVDRDWWQEMLGTADREPVATPPAPAPVVRPAPAAEASPVVEPVTAPLMVERVPPAEAVPSAEELLAAPVYAPRTGPGTDAPRALAPRVDIGPMGTSLPDASAPTGPSPVPTAPDLLAGAAAGAPAAPAAAPRPASPAAPAAAPQSAPPARPRRPQRVEPVPPQATPAVRPAGPPAAPVSPPAAAPRPQRRSVRELFGRRVADIGLVLLALAVVLLVFLALSR